MHIQQEVVNVHSVLSYTTDSLIIGDTAYQGNVILSERAIIRDWGVNSVSDLNEVNCEPILKLAPKIILIGCNEQNAQIPLQLMSYLSTKQIGIECMTIGAACRTFNVLLSEGRAVVAGIFLGK